MANRQRFKATVAERRRRHFSDGFKKSKVLEIEQGRSSVSEIGKQYEVSTVNIYRWIGKFGTMKKNERLIVETDSDTRQLLELKKRVAELERVVGQKQILLDFQNKMIDLAEEEYKVDIKKKYSSKLLDQSGLSGKSTFSA